MDETQKSRWSGAFPLSLGLGSLAALIAVFGIWGTQVKIAGAIVTSGVVAVEINRQVVQHIDGGVVGEILAKDGDAVTAGQVVLKLDGTFLQSELSIVEDQLFELAVRKARHKAERDDDIILEMSKNVKELVNKYPRVSGLFDGQKRLFMARRDTQGAQEDQIDEQIQQTREQIAGISSELNSLELQLNFLKEELDANEELLERGLTQVPRVLALKRTEAQLIGNIGRLHADIAQLKGQIAGLNIQKIGLSTIRREEAITALRDLQVTESELSQKRLALSERLKRLDVRAPVAGTIFGSSVFALQAVIRPAEPLMYVIPVDQPMIVNAQVDAIHIDQIHVGQEVILRFPTFDQRTTPELFGKVSRVSADVMLNELTRQQFYQAELTPNADIYEKLKGQILLPGMPVEAFIKTRDRTPLSYLIKPLGDYFVKAFREN